MKKICFVTTISMTIRAFVLPVVRYFAEHTDWCITVVCDNDPTLAQELPEGVRFVPISMKRGISLSGFDSVQKLYRLFREESFDFVQYSTPNAAFYAAIAARLARIQHRKYHLMGFRYLGFTGVKRRIFKLVEYITCKLSTDIECVSRSNMTLGIQEKVFAETKAHVVFHGSSAGIDLQRFDIQKKSGWRETLRKQLGYENDQCVFGFAGRITGDKGINDLLQAFQKLTPHKNKLLFVGGIEYEGLDPKLLAYAERNPDITFYPFVSDIERFFSAMDVLVLPSYREGFGNIVIEAQAMGVPVIVTNIPGPVDAMEENKTGLIVPKANVAALSKAMNTLSVQEELRLQYGLCGRHFVEECFDSKVLFKHILQDRKKLLHMQE